MTQKDLRTELSIPTSLPAAEPSLLIGEAISSAAGQAPPEGRECIGRLKTEMHSIGAATAISVLQPYLRDLAFVQRRDSLSEPEKRALVSLLEVQKSMAETAAGGNGVLKPIGGSGDIFLRDVFNCLLDRENDRAGNPLILRATACPDYETDGQGHYLSRGGLGTSPGLSASKMVEALKPLLSEMSGHSVPVILELCYADIEALDPIMIKKSGVPTAEFLERVQESGRQAEQKFRGELSELRIDAAVRAGSMCGILGDGPQQELAERLKAANITSSHVGGIASHRRSFYSRFFAEQSRGLDLGEFYDARAAKDIDDHLRLGKATALDRARGERETLVTMSIPALARFLRHSSDSVPVLAVHQEY